MNIGVDEERSGSMVFNEFFAERASRVYTGYVVFFSLGSTEYFFFLRIRIANRAAFLAIYLI